MIDSGSRWRKVGRLEAGELRKFVQKPSDIWGTENHGYIRARVPTAEADQMGSSLLLLRLREACIDVKKWPERWTVRVGFEYRGVHYDFAATDPAFKAESIKKGEGSYSLASRTYGCISLGEPDNGYRFKLAAAVFEVN